MMMIVLQRLKFVSVKLVFLNNQFEINRYRDGTDESEYAHLPIDILRTRTIIVDMKSARQVSIISV